MISNVIMLSLVLKKGGDAWASSPFAILEKIPLTF